MTLFALGLIFIFGSIIGSFLSVLIYRLNQGKKGIISGRSMCPSCKKRIKIKHLIPIVSWLMLRGKCANCGKKISWHYLLLELLTGLVFAIVFLKWNFLQTTISTVSSDILLYSINWETFRIFLFYIIEFSFLIAIFFYDLIHKEIPDSFSLPAIAIAILGVLYFQQISWINMIYGATTIFVFFLIQFLISKGSWIGGGDLRLGILMGTLLGFEHGLLALILAYFIGAIFSIYLLASARVNRKSQIAFGPFLVIGIFISMFYGREILDYYFNFILI